jgi:hypothetical protein
MTQTWLVVDADMPADVSLTLCESLGCNGFFSGVPPFLREIAASEAWILPHVWTETVEHAQPVDIAQQS